MVSIFKTFPAKILNVFLYSLSSDLKSLLRETCPVHDIVSVAQVMFES